MAASNTTDLPERTCVGCRTKRPSAQLLRLTFVNGHVVAGGPSQGRGAWICPGSNTCVEQAMRRRAFQRAWRTNVGAPVVDTLQRAILDAVSGARPDLTP